MPPRNPTPDIMADVRAQTPSILDDLMRADERIQQLPIDALDDNAV